MNCHEAELLARRLMNQHGLDSWYFQFRNWVTSFGMCSQNRKVISLSEPLTSLNTEAEVRDVILHEIAHALVGRGHGHDSVWKNKCIEIGARPERCSSRRNVVQPNLRYEAICQACGAKYTRVRKPDRLSSYACDCQAHKPWKEKTKLKYRDTLGNTEK